MNVGAAGTGANHYRGEAVDETDAAGRLAEAAAEWDRTASPNVSWRYGLIAALLPVVREIADQRAAEELEAAGGDLPMAPRPWEANQLLARRAAALRGEAGR